MKLTRTVAPATDPVSLSEARTWLNMQSGVTADDAVISTRIDEVTAYLELRLCGRKLISQTWTVELDEDEIADEITLPILPLISVTSINTYDNAGVETLVASSNYQVLDGDESMVVLTSTGEWPTDVRDYRAMKITAVFGYATLPMDITLAFRQLLLFYYLTKGIGENHTVSGMPITIPRNIEHIIASYRSAPWS